MINRRNFLKSTALLTTASLFTPKFSPLQAATVSATAEKVIGLQIYSLGGELYKNVPQGMKQLKSYGYSTLELAGYNSGKIRSIDMMEFKKMANDAGLSIISSHVNPPTREYTADNKKQIAEFWKKAADDHAKMGVSYLIQPGQPFTRNNEEVAIVCDVFNEAGKIAKSAGLSFGYHNHEMEFAHVQPGGKASAFGRGAKGDVIYDLMLEGTDPEKVFFELDVYWAVMGQQDPVAYLKKYPKRIKVLHIKDRSVLGQSGMMNFEQIFKQAQANGIKDYFVELEGLKANQSQFEGVKGCCEYLKRASFVK